MKLDRKGQVWQIKGEEVSASYVIGHVAWKTFMIVSTSDEVYDTISGEERKYVKHKVVVSETSFVVDLNEDISFPWEECREEYRRII